MIHHWYKDLSKERRPYSDEGVVILRVQEGLITFHISYSYDKRKKGIPAVNNQTVIGHSHISQMKITILTENVLQRCSNPTHVPFTRQTLKEIKDILESSLLRMVWGVMIYFVNGNKRVYRNRTSKKLPIQGDVVYTS